MSPTLLEFAVLILLIVVAWQIGLAIAPSIIRAIRALKQDVDEATDQGFSDADPAMRPQHTKKEHTNGTTQH